MIFKVWASWHITSEIVLIDSNGHHVTADTGILYTKYCFNDKAVQKLDAMILASQGITAIAGAFGLPPPVMLAIVGFFQLYRSWIKWQNEGEGVCIIIWNMGGIPIVTSR